MVNLNAQEKIEKNILLFQYQVKKDLITVKQLHIDSFRFISTSLSSLVNNLSDGFQCNKCIDCKSSLDYIITRDDQLILGVLSVKRIIKKTLIRI